jgi:hypothetical protein
MELELPCIYENHNTQKVVMIAPYLPITSGNNDGLYANTQQSTSFCRNGFIDLKS